MTYKLLFFEEGQNRNQYLGCTRINSGITTGGTANCKKVIEYSIVFQKSQILNDSIRNFITLSLHNTKKNITHVFMVRVGCTITSNSNTRLLTKLSWVKKCTEEITFVETYYLFISQNLFHHICYKLFVKC